MHDQLTERQNQIYEFIRSHVQSEGMPPTISEIRDHLGLVSTNGVHKHLHALEKKGVLVRTPNVSRGLRLLAKDPDAFSFDEGTPSLPLIPRMNAQQRDLLRLGKQHLQVDLRFMAHVDPEDCLAGRAGDDGMAGRGILKGDFLVIEEAGSRPLREGTLVAVLIGDLLAARVIGYAGERVTFAPEATRYKTKSFIVGSPAYFVIGPILAVMRKL
ncbi:MAG: LexA family transcriptional regulator [Bacteroidota bacterium]